MTKFDATGPAWLLIQGISIHVHPPRVILNAERDPGKDILSIVD